MPETEKSVLGWGKLIGFTGGFSQKCENLSILFLAHWTLEFLVYPSKTFNLSRAYRLHELIYEMQCM